MGANPLKIWCRRAGLNCRPQPYQDDAPQHLVATQATGTPHLATCATVFDMRSRRCAHYAGTALGLKSEGGNTFLKTLSGKKPGSEIGENLREKLENPIVFNVTGADPGSCG
jgi:hypothetical protein